MTYPILTTLFKSDSYKSLGYGSFLGTPEHQLSVLSTNQNSQLGNVSALWLVKRLESRLVSTNLHVLGLNKLSSHTCNKV